MTVNRRTRHKTLLPETNTMRRASVTVTLCLAALLWSCGQPDEAPPDTAVEEHAPAVQVSRESEPRGGDTRLHDRLFRSPDAPDPLRQAAGFRDGAMAVLLGVAARKSARSGQPVRIASLTSLTPQAVRVRS